MNQPVKKTGFTVLYLSRHPHLSTAEITTIPRLKNTLPGSQTPQKKNPQATTPLFQLKIKPFHLFKKQRPAKMSFKHVLTIKAVSKLQSYQLISKSTDNVGCWKIQSPPFPIKFPHTQFQNRKILWVYSYFPCLSRFSSLVLKGRFGLWERSCSILFSRSGGKYRYNRKKQL